MRAPTPVYCGGREPVYLAALAFSVGTIAGNQLWAARPHLWLVACVIVGIGVCVLYRRALSLAFPFALLVSGSAGHAVFRGVRRSPDHTSKS